MVDSLLGGGGPGGTGKQGVRYARLLRTVLLGALAVLFGVYWLARSYGVDLEELLEYARASLAFVLFFVLAGILGGILIFIARYLARHFGR